MKERERDGEREREREMKKDRQRERERNKGKKNRLKDRKIARKKVAVQMNSGRESESVFGSEILGRNSR